MRIVRQHRQASPREGAQWLFDHGVDTNGHRELAGLGLIIKMLGTFRGFAWMLSAEGRDRVRALTLEAQTGVSATEYESGVFERAGTVKRLAE